MNAIGSERTHGIVREETEDLKPQIAEPAGVIAREDGKYERKRWPGLDQRLDLLDHSIRLGKKIERLLLDHSLDSEQTLAAGQQIGFLEEVICLDVCPRVIRQVGLDDLDVRGNPEEVIHDLIEFKHEKILDRACDVSLRVLPVGLDAPHRVSLPPHVTGFFQQVHHGRPRLSHVA